MKNHMGTVIIILSVCILIAIIIVFCSLNVSKEEEGEKVERKSVVEKGNKKEKKRKSEGKEINVVPTILDKIDKDSSWCCTFQLIWNDVKKEIAKQDIKFSPEMEIAKNLNKESFNENMISEEYYYKKYGVKSLELKSEIEKGIKEKFNQQSDILDDFQWGKDIPDTSGTEYFFYSMLYRRFEYPKEFDKLKNGKFGKEDNIEYFGITNDTHELVDNQVKVLFYKSKEDFAIKINTNSKDEIVFYKNPKGDTFKSIYENMNKEISQYKGRTIFEERDTFKAPYLNFNVKREYSELEGKEFITKDKNTAIIAKALQTIKFSIDEKGGEVKSEAGMDVMLKALVPTDEGPRDFSVDNTFVLFLKEKGNDMPYFAAKVDDIKKYQ